jgi:hypothetical protein
VAGAAPNVRRPAGRSLDCQPDRIEAAGRPPDEHDRASAAASACAMPAPMPLPAPVTSAPRPRRSIQVTAMQEISLRLARLGKPRG